jgi:hypothetical protein
MRRTLAAAALALAATPALATPKEDMCRFVSILASEGVSAAMAFTEQLADLWAPEQRAKLGVVVGSELEKFDYRGGQVYEIANLPGAVEEYFITLNLIGRGSVYLRVLYEGNARDPLAFINIDFKASYHDAIRDPFLQPPKPVACPG